MDPQGGNELKKFLDDSRRLPRIYPMRDPIVLKISQKHNKLPEHILLRHLIQKNIAVIPKSFNKLRVCSNFQVFDFKLCDTEMEALNQLDQGPRLRLFREMIKGLSIHPEWPFQNEP